jgi:hypothetical protein
MSVQLSHFAIPSIHKMFIWNQSPQPYEFLTNCSGLLERSFAIVGFVERIFGVPRRLLPLEGVLWGAMTPVIFITIGFLSCWFLLYALVEWTQDRQRKSGASSGADEEISRREHWNQRVVHFRNKERL